MTQEELQEKYNSLQKELNNTIDEDLKILIKVELDELLTTANNLGLDISVLNLEIKPTEKNNNIDLTNIQTNSSTDTRSFTYDSQTNNYFQLAEAEMKAGRYFDAISFYNTILGLNASNYNVWYLKAIAVFKSSTLGNCRFLESKAFFEEAIKLSHDASMKTTISDKIVELAEVYFPAYENFFKEHFKAPSSVDSLFNTYSEFDSMIYWSIELNPNNSHAYEVGYKLSKKIVEMPLKYVDSKRWGALGNEIAAKVTKNYGNEITAKVDREIATEVLNKVKNYTNKLILNSQKYEKGINGINELKQLIAHNNIVLKKPKLTSVGKSFDDWHKNEKKSNKQTQILGLVIFIIGVYNISGSKFWMLFCFGAGLYCMFAPKWNRPTQEKYSKQQGELAKWLSIAHGYIKSNNIDMINLNKLYNASKSIYDTYFYFHPDQKIDPSSIINSYNDLFFKDNAPFKI